MAEASELRIVQRQLAEKTQEFDEVVAEWEALNEQAVATEQLLQRQSELLAAAMRAGGTGAPAATEREVVSRVQRQSEAIDVCAALALRQQAELQSARQRVVAQSQRLASSADLTTALLDEIKGERATNSVNQRQAVARLEAQCAKLDEARACIDGLRAAHAAAASAPGPDYEASMARRISQQAKAMDKIVLAAQEQRETLRAQRETIAKQEAVEKELRKLLLHAEQAAAVRAEPVVVEPQIEPEVLEKWTRVVAEAANETASLRQQLKDARESCAREHARHQSQSSGHESDTSAAVQRLCDARREMATERLRMRRIVEAATGVPRPTIKVEFNSPGPLGLKLNAHETEGPKLVKINAVTQAAAKPELTVGLLLETLDGQCLVGTPYKDILQMLRKSGRPTVMTFIPESTGSFDDQLARVTSLRVELSAEMEAAASRAHELQRSQQEVAQANAELQAAMAKAAAAEDRYNEDVASAAVQSRQKQDEIASLEQKVVAAAQRERDLTDQMQKAQQKHAQVVEDLRAETDLENTQALRAADEERRRLASQLEEARQELRAAKETRTTGVQSLSAAQSSSAAAGDPSSHRKEIEHLKEQIKGNMAREAILQAKLEETVTTMATIQASNSEMDEAAKQLTSEREANAARVRELETNVARESEEAARLRGLLSDGQAAKQAVQVELQTAEQQLSVVRSELDSKLSEDAERRHKEETSAPANSSTEHAEQIRAMQRQHEAELAKALKRAAEAEAAAQSERSRDSQSLSEKLAAAEAERASMQAQIEQRNDEQRAIELRLAAEEARSAALLEAVQHLGRGAPVNTTPPAATPASAPYDSAGSARSRSSSPESPTAAKFAATLAEQLPTFGGGPAHYSPARPVRSSSSSSSSEAVRAAAADLSEGVPPTATLQAMRRRMRELEEEAKSSLHSVYGGSNAAERSPPPRAQRSIAEPSNYSPVRLNPHSPSYFGSGRGASATSPPQPGFRSNMDAEVAMSSLEHRLQHQLSELEVRLGRTERALSPVPPHEQPAATARAPDWGYGSGAAGRATQQRSAINAHSPQPMWPQEMQLTHGGDGRSYGRLGERLGDPDTIGVRSLVQQQQQYEQRQPSSPQTERDRERQREAPSRFGANSGGYSGYGAPCVQHSSAGVPAINAGGARSGSKSREAALRSVTAIAQRYAMDYS